jgi:hypothetical protein
MSTVHKANPQLARDHINPQTGEPWRLSDPEIQAETAVEMRAMKQDPKLAKRFLQEVGILNAKGKLTKRYGG